ncbi:DUF5365 family protein [Anoxybacillus rupiensis]|uniref:DUF5365 family protein n=1 Tax=Anoxybacteroides rupiense TaxID=311460 RepID=A0ABD5IXZ1_9BACL|nr:MULTISPECIES: DUF5365 family protein [Anoxybacillus]KXG09991.1 hypothetical protein AT864_01551 [Anoxybacillus sp. P3H1B]MBB3907679.1 hypothetical protein [Anoxybacillus rupiensis]MBS2771657.1 DUF5365 family protein [Anoxybacillus rupiensis]MDE8564254.1 DUF5365 family protein [Anoxybacillus rupiensis]MED5052231.1 DUF5365 family protein [Anoxybacillus rupiensis]
MKVVNAATKEHEEHIGDLIHCFYSEVFPCYFDDEQIQKFEQLQILSMEGLRYNGTMKEAFQLISALQSLLTVIECIEHHGIQEGYHHLFERNVQLLEKFGISFPFTIDQFRKKRRRIFSMYSRPQNDWVM